MLERYEELSVGESPAADQSNPWIGPGLITIVFGLLTLWSWRRWPDLLVDFGRELYSPWQLAGGKLLYRDVASLFGPFSQYFNAVGFRLFGVSFTTLIVCNMAILAGITAITYRLFAACLNRFTATAVSIVFLAMFGFSEYTIIGNYNFISPYSHETTHGVACALLMIYAFQRWLQRGLLWWAFLAGSCLGISLLTKPEIAMAAAASAVTGVILIAGAVTERRCPAPAMAVALFGVLTPIAIFFAYFGAFVPPTDAGRYVMGAWLPLFSRTIFANIFYLQGMGLDAPWENLARMAYLALCAAVFVGIAVAIDARMRGAAANPLRLNLALSLALMMVFIALRITWRDSGRAIPALSFATLGMLALHLHRGRHDHAVRVRLIPLIMWNVLGLAFLAKILLYTRFYHYGFALAMPATLLVVGFGIGYMPEMCARSAGGGKTLQVLVITAICTGVGWHLALSRTLYQHKNVEIGSGGDTIRVFDSSVSPAGPIAGQALDWIKQRTPVNSTMVVLPEGVMLNYLARRVNPTRYINFMPPELAVSSETDIVTALNESRPDIVVVVHKDTTEYGVPFFGTSAAYGKTIMDWVRRHYHQTAIFGTEPFRGPDFGIQILERVR